MEIEIGAVLTSEQFPESRWTVVNVGPGWVVFLDEEGKRHSLKEKQMIEAKKKFGMAVSAASPGLQTQPETPSQAV